MNLSCNPSEAFEIKANSIKLKQYPDDLLMYFSGTDTDLNLTVAEGLVSPFDPTQPDKYHVMVKGDYTGFPYTFVDKGYALTYYKNNFRNFSNGCLRATVKKEDCENDYSYQDFYGYTGDIHPGQYMMVFNVWRYDNGRVILSKEDLYKITSCLKGAYFLIPKGISGVAKYVRYTCKRDFDGITIDDSNVNDYFDTRDDYYVNTFIINLMLYDGDEIFSLEGSDQLEKLSQLINTEITNDIGYYDQFGGDFPKPFKTEVIYNQDESYCLRFRTDITEGAQVAYYLEMAKMSESNERSLKTWFSDIKDPSYFCAPSVDTKVISFHEADGIKNELSLIHKTDGFLYLFMADEDGKYTLTKKLCQWVWNNEDFVEFELNFDNSLSNFIANGEVKAFFETVGVDAQGHYDSIIRNKHQETFMTLVGGGDGYGFKEIDIFNKKQHCGAYKAPESVTYYDGSYYVEYRYGDISVFDDSKLNIEGSGNLLFEVFDDGIPLSFDNEEGMGVIVKSDDIDDFIGLFDKVDYDADSKLAFESNNLVFRVTFLDKDAELTKFEFENGTEVYDASDPYNFEDLYDWVRRQLGAPQIACELTDEQIYDALCKAIEKYNKYRNWNENLSIYDLDNADPEDTTLLRKGHSDREGNYFILPANISSKDIVDIFFQPRFSTCWFGAGDTFLNNVMSQTFFGLYGGIVQNSADYYIWRISCNDISNIIGTQISWRVYNNHLYITPGNLHDLDQFKVGIKYRPSLTIEEIRNSEDIKALTLAYAMRTLGLIRGSFGGSIQAGDIAIQLNAETLLAEADKLEDKTIALLKSEQKPLWMIWS